MKRKNTGYGSSISSSRGGKKKWSRGEKASDPSSCLGTWIHNLVWIAQHLDREIYCSSLSFFWLAGLKTAAAVGGGAYVGYQLGKFTGRLVFILLVCCLLWYFVQRRHVQVWPLGTRRWLGTQGLQQVEGTGRDVVQVREHFSVPLFNWSFFKQDHTRFFLFSFSTGSFLNRSTQDCTWMDPNLLCQDYEMDFSMTVSNLILSKSISKYTWLKATWSPPYISP